MLNNLNSPQQQNIDEWAYKAYGDVKDRAWDHFDPLPTGTTDQALRKAIVDYFYACARRPAGDV
jgi:hypothetical protein